MKTAIVTDSSSYLSKKELKKYNIHIIPLEIIFENQSFQEGINLSNKEFYQKLDSSKKLPTTSQPPIGKLIKLYNQLADEGYDTVITITLAATISGLYNQVVNVSKMVSNIRIIPFDSQITVSLMGDLAKYAANLAAQNVDPDTIIVKLKEQRATIDELFIVADLQNLVKGGRLSNASAFIGGLLNIKPILTFDNQTDEIVAFEKVRTMKRALKRVEKLFSEDLEHIDYPIKAIIYDANDSKSGKIWVKNFKKNFPNINVEHSYIGPAIGTHLGEGALVLGWEKDLNLK
ncbi:fatty acid-binding protein DegV [Fructilactobacillus lindneri]|uniref:DegV family protein n=2 Tax=Fructilactobacillus lindneri TaxID=53444 RepID=A0A0R2JPH0_9LACO|nr:DegV family protein [Fructilactobacillus lindneri]ANZ58178.1 fatty acid-binding protein DegV [Fructilactobacillus lindneri]ANZ59499.1 fatty acid-binding protein DegV [Fructilactobacillus lindneri]KRN79000.1 hypothetical protein IV52_GL000404 [Fructilactobacillus lindneri DSM 20690 = JCM 11027]POG98717.1 fatty acid-binding protein DegV [Fructilactobacillus lindneri]POH02990.1 fatty acid-binding protein DegV [Fructilactobacillus lindneri]